MKERLEVAILIGAAMWLNFQWVYITPKPKHAFHHRAQGRAKWHFGAGAHRGGYRGLAAAGVAR